MSQSMTRRQFLITSAVVAGSAAVASGVDTLLDEISIAAPKYDLSLISPGEEKIVPSVCSLCPNGCGMHVRVVDGRVV